MVRWTARWRVRSLTPMVQQRPGPALGELIGRAGYSSAKTRPAERCCAPPGGLTVSRCHVLHGATYCYICALPYSATSLNPWAGVPLQVNCWICTPLVTDALGVSTHRPSLATTRV
jgi:hypothetical protein